MTDRLEHLALLTERVQHFALAPGGTPYLTSEDMGFILATIKDPITSKFGRMMLAGETRWAEEVELAMYTEVRLWKDMEYWRVPRPHWLEDLCFMALSEEVAPAICLQCNGRAEVIYEAKPIECPSCEGRGKKHIYDTDRAEFMGLDKSNWSRTWNRRYRRIRTIPDRYTSELAVAVNQYTANLSATAPR